MCTLSGRKMHNQQERHRGLAREKPGSGKRDSLPVKRNKEQQTLMSHGPAVPMAGLSLPAERPFDKRALPAWRSCLPIELARDFEVGRLLDFQLYKPRPVPLLFLCSGLHEPSLLAHL